MKCMNTDHYYSLRDLTVSAILNLGFFFVSILSLRKTEKQFFPNISIRKQVFLSLASSNENVLQCIKAGQLFLFAVSYCVNVGPGATKCWL